MTIIGHREPEEAQELRRAETALKHARESLDRMNDLCGIGRCAPGALLEVAAQVEAAQANYREAWRRWRAWQEDQVAHVPV